MAPLDKVMFAGGGNIDRESGERLEVKNWRDEVEEKLKQRGWDGTAGCCSVGLFLSADNALVEAGAFIVSGPVDGKQLCIEATRIWPNADARAALILRFRNGGIFTFSEGGLASDIIASEAVEHSLVATADGRQPAPILAAQYEDWGWKGFCLRMLCHISKKSSTRSGVIIGYTILLFPMEKEALLERYELAQSAAWPGIRIAEGQLPLLPRPTTPWGCPVLPLLRTGTPLAEGGTLPSGEVLRAAIGAIMGQQATAETGRTGSAVLAKWEKLANNPEEMVLREGETTWPKTSMPAPNTGKK